MGRQLEGMIFKGAWLGSADCCRLFIWVLGLSIDVTGLGINLKFRVVGSSRKSDLLYFRI